jgi:hypothetical protein
MISFTRARALAKIRRVGRRARLLGHVLQDRRTLRHDEAFVVEHRHLTRRIDARERRLHVFARHQIDHDRLVRNVLVREKKQHRARSGGNRMEVKLHDP